MKTFVKAAAMLMLGLALRGGQSAGQQAEDAAAVIGRINGAAILKKNVVESRSSLTTLFRIKHQRDPNTPEDEQEIASEGLQLTCLRLTGELDRVARNDQIRKRGIFVTDEELVQRGRDNVKGQDVEAYARRTRETTKALLAALAEVYDKGGDPQQAYVKYLAPAGISEADWRVDLEGMRTPKARAKLATGTLVTADLLRAPARNLRSMMENEKLYADVDRELASGDSRFARFLTEAQSKGHMLVDHFDYLQAKRLEWWRARYAELDMVLYDPELANQCKLGEMGVHLNGSSR